jgi:SsrA-binding protein
MMPSCSLQLIGFSVTSKDLMNDSAKKVVATNRKASHDYFLLDRLEAGIALQGSEIKSVRAGQVSLRESYVRIDDHEAWLVNAHIAPYDPASTLNHEPRRLRRLLLHKREIRRLYEKVRIRGYSLIPTIMYLIRGRAKIEIALARGKKQYDKRREIAKRDAEREISRTLRRRGS